MKLLLTPFFPLFFCFISVLKSLYMCVSRSVKKFFFQNLVFAVILNLRTPVATCSTYLGRYLKSLLNHNFRLIAKRNKILLLALFQALFAPERLFTDGGIDPILRGLFATPLKTPQTNELLNSVLTEKLFHRGHDVNICFPNLIDTK